MPTKLTNDEIITFVNDWIVSWNLHDLDGVLRGMTDDVEFEHWTGRITGGIQLLRRAWQPWFETHGDFHFSVSNIYADTEKQSAIFEWDLEWPSPEPSFIGQREIRKGIDVINLRNGKVANKRSYIKTLVKLNGRSVLLTSST